ncbi:MAG: MEDS domain-containing protein, partial [Thermodesulfovibrionales bacterium]
MNTDKNHQNNNDTPCDLYNMFHQLIYDIYDDNLSIKDIIQRLQGKEHLCLIYKTEDEWKDTVIPYISAGLENGEKCIYIVDEHTAKDIRTYLEGFGVDVRAFEDSGQLSIRHQGDSYTIGNIFDPDRVIELLKIETQKSIQEGYKALRVTGEMSWTLKDVIGSDRIFEYEKRVNSELFAHYPCIGLCQYNMSIFPSDVIKGVILSHPFLIYGGRVCRNFYHFSPDECPDNIDKEVEHWLSNLIKNHELEKAMFIYDKRLRESEEKYYSLFNNARVGLFRTRISDGKLLACNEKMAKIFGFDEIDHALEGVSSITTHYVEHDGRKRFLEIIKRDGSIDNYETPGSPDSAAAMSAQARQDRLTKPQGALG